MPYPVWTAGQTITAQMLIDMQWHTVEQALDQDVTSSTTLVDSGIVIPGVANATYRYKLRVRFQSSAVADIKFAWSVPSLATMGRFLAGPGTSATGGNANFTTTSWRWLTATTESAIGGGGASVSGLYIEDGEIVMSSTAGNVTLRFAQNTSEATTTRIVAGSYADYLRIG
jgi:hypothetical protein